MLLHGLRRSVCQLTWTVALVALVGAGCAQQPPAPPSAPTQAPPAAAAAPTLAAPAPTQPGAAPTPTTAAPAKPAAAAEPSEWVIGVTQEPTALDPNTGTTTSPANQTVYYLIYDNLVRTLALREGPDFKEEMQLAESYKVLDDVTWEFKLRKGVKFQNGDEFTAEDFKYTFDDYLQEGKARSGLRDIVERVEIADPSTIRVRTKGPQAGLVDRVGGVPIMPKKAREAVGAEAFNQKPIGSGPYKVVEWARGQRLVLEANPNYWAGKVFPEKIVIRPIPDPTTRMAELKVGNVQIIQAPPIAALKEIESDPNLELKVLPAGRTMQYKFNITQKPLDDVRVRQAMNYAVDRDAIIKNVLEGHGGLMTGTFSKGWMGFDPGLQSYPYDIAKAKELLAAAGYAPGFETSFNTTGGVYLKDREIAEAVGAQLEQVGIRMRIVVAEPTKLLSDWVAGNFEGLLLSPWGTAADPDGMLGYQYFKRKAYQDLQLDQLVDKTRATLDPAQRVKTLQELSRYVHEQALNLEIHSQDEFWAKRKNIQWEPYPIGSYSYALMWRLVR